ncbi:death-associated protein 1 [Limosa lapponica baueri]|uniref:Death-associated protein 1 n=1 Tax=Limosa lapponica baueri TaxID=1758121 RepID=A0A2I0UU35_LIMLA|nr:death-associated protein 1 [Limosa lapponica baueri]
MVATRQKAVKKTVGTQTEATHKHAGIQATGCSECWNPATANGGDNTCVRCEQIKDLLNMVAELKEEVKRLRSIRECERELDLWYQALQTPLAEGDDPGNRGEWIQVPVRRGKGNPSQPPSPYRLPLHNKYGALKVEGEEDEKVEETPSGGLPIASQSPPCIRTSTLKKKRRVIVIGDSLLKGTATFFYPGKSTPIQAMSRQFLQENVVGNSVKDFTEVQVNNIYNLSLTH